tara:strand:+ start:76995 stop:77297 length:303 start_codon:yes stop_codon:yes gene_type:complete
MIYIKVFLVWISNIFGFGFQQDYSKGWNKKVIDMLESGCKVTNIDGHTVTFENGVTIWISNKYYSYAHPYHCNLPKVRPSIKTMIRLNEYIKESAFKEFK